MKLNELEAVVESLLFISGEAVPISVLAQTIDMDKATTKAIVRCLSEKYAIEKRGLQIVEYENAYQMCTSPKCFEYIKNMYKSPKKQGLTQALLETLAIIAYKQPITKAQIEEIRGVNSDHSVNKLVEKKLVCEKGRLDTPGKPILFATTKEFLRYFGFTSVKELPPLDETLSVKNTENI